MRLDKFLKISRLVKRRTLANELCDGGKVLLNGKVAKAASVVKPGDQVTLHLGFRTRSVEILEVPEKPPSVQAASLLYRVLAETYNGPHPDPS